MFRVDLNMLIHVDQRCTTSRQSNSRSQRECWQVIKKKKKNYNINIIFSQQHLPEVYLPITIYKNLKIKLIIQKTETSSNPHFSCQNRFIFLLNWLKPKHFHSFNSTLCFRLLKTNSCNQSWRNSGVQTVFF